MSSLGAQPGRVSALAPIMLKTIGVHGFDHRTIWPAKVRNVSRLGSQYSKTPVGIRTRVVFGGLFIGIGGMHPKKTLELVKLSNSFFMHAIDLGYQRR